MKNSLPDNPGTIRESQSEKAQDTSVVKAYTLSELTHELCFFNHGSLFQYAGFRYPEMDPASEWMSKQDSATPVLMILPFKHVLFTGLSVPAIDDSRFGSIPFSNVVFAAHKDCWPKLKAFLSGVASIDRKKKLYSQTYSEDINLPDPSIVARGGVVTADTPRVQVTVFCVDSNQKNVKFLQPQGSDVFSRCVSLPANPRTCDVAKAVFADNFEPLGERCDQDFCKKLLESLDDQGAKTDGDST